jgi:hypothetical protein
MGPEPVEFRREVSYFSKLMVSCRVTARFAIGGYEYFHGDLNLSVLAERGLCGLGAQRLWIHSM